MQWTGGANAGFSAGTPWLGVNPDHETWNAHAQRGDPASVLAHYRRLIALRHDRHVVALGDFTMLLPDDEQVYAFTRALGDVELLVLANVSGQPASVPVPDGWHGSEVLLGNVDGEAPGGAGELRPWEARVHKLVRNEGGRA